MSSSEQPADAATQEANELDLVLKLLHWSGTMRHPHAGPWATRMHYVIHAISMLALVLFDFSLVVLLFQEGAADLERFTLTLSVLNTVGFFTLRLRHIAAKEPEFHTLALRVRRDCGEFLGAGDLINLRQGSGGMRRVLLAYQWSLMLTAVAYSSVPVNADGLPFVMALPYDATQPFAYECTWLFCAFIIFSVHIGTMAADSFSVTVILHLHNQLDMLGRNLCSLNDTISHVKTSSFQALNTKNALHSDASHDIHYRLRKSVLHHQAIIRNVQLLEECLGGMLLGQSLSIGTSFCLQLFQAATRAKGVQELGKTCSYLVTAFSMLFIYCWYGDDLISESEKLAFSSYDAVTSLQSCPTSIKRSLLLLMVRAQRPLQLTAGGFFALSRESFVAVLNASYSFFAILRNFKEE